MGIERAFFEERIKAFALTNGFPICLQNVPFKRPTSGVWLEVFVNPTECFHRELSASTQMISKIGVFQVFVWVQSGQGLGQAELVASKIIDLFPVLPKIGVSIERPGCIEKAITPDTSGWVAVPITFDYKYN